MSGRGFYYPVDIAINEDGRIYGLSRSHEGDPRGVRVTILDLESEFYGVFGSIGEGDGQFTWATSIAIDSQGLVYVSDEFLERISVFDATGNFLSKWGTHGSEHGELDGPSGLAFDHDDNLYVADHRNNRIQKFTKDGRFLSTFGSEGQGDGQFALPWGINIDVRGDVWVADWRNDRIQRFSPDGEFLAKYGSPGQRRRRAPPAVKRRGGRRWVHLRRRLGETKESRSSTPTAGSSPSSGARRRCPSGGRTSSGPTSTNQGLGRDQTSSPTRASSNRTLTSSPLMSRSCSGGRRPSSWISEGRLYVVDRNRHRIQVYRRT